MLNHLPLVLLTVAGTLFAVAYRPEWVTRPSAFRVPPTPALLRGWAILLTVGAGLVVLGFWQGRRYGPAGCSAVADLAAQFQNLDLSVREMSRATDDFTRLVSTGPRDAYLHLAGRPAPRDSAGP